MSTLRRAPREQAAAFCGDFDAATQAHGLHAPGGRVTTTGLGGFTTGGGYGWTSCKHGLACDNLISAEVVLADGSVVTAQEDEHAAPDEASTACVVLIAPLEPFVPAELHGKPVLAVPVLFVGDPEDGADAVRPLRDMDPAVDHIGEMPYTAFQAALDPLAPWGVRSHWRGEYMRELGDHAIDTFLTHGVELTTAGAPLSQMIIFRIGQGVAGVPEGATAFSHRDAAYLFHPISVWTDPADDARMIEGNRGFAAAMRPFSTGASYLNFTPEPDRVRDAYGYEKYRRLAAIKDAYDPMNLFRLNQNIRPTAALASANTGM